MPIALNEEAAKDLNNTVEVVHLLYSFAGTDLCELREHAVGESANCAILRACAMSQENLLYLQGSIKEKIGWLPTKRYGNMTTG